MKTILSIDCCWACHLLPNKFQELFLPFYITVTSCIENTLMITNSAESQTILPSCPLFDIGWTTLGNFKNFLSCLLGIAKLFQFHKGLNRVTPRAVSINFWYHNRDQWGRKMQELISENSIVSKLIKVVPQLVLEIVCFCAMNPFKFLVLFAVCQSNCRFLLWCKKAIFIFHFVIPQTV